MPGARCTRGLVCKMHKVRAHEHTGSAESPGLPCAMVLTAYFVLSPVTGLFVTVAPREACFSRT